MISFTSVAPQPVASQAIYTKQRFGNRPTLPKFDMENVLQPVLDRLGIEVRGNEGNKFFTSERTRLTAYQTGAILSGGNKKHPITSISLDHYGERLIMNLSLDYLIERFPGLREMLSKGLSGQTPKIYVNPKGEITYAGIYNKEAILSNRDLRVKLEHFIDHFAAAQEDLLGADVYAADPTMDLRWKLTNTLTPPPQGYDFHNPNDLRIPAPFGFETHQLVAMQPVG